MARMSFSLTTRNLLQKGLSWLRVVTLENDGSQ